MFSITKLLSWRSLILVHLFLGYYALDAQSTARKEDGRFNLVVEGYPAIDPDVDPYKLLENFQIQVEWWTLLGEPMEYYYFKWKAADSYLLNDVVISRQSLAKYPDLLKRYDNLRPVDINIKLSGSFSAEGSTRNPPADLEPFYSEGSHRFFRDVEFNYIVNDIRLMPSISGKTSESVVPSSPKRWEHFLQYSTFLSRFGQMFGHLSAPDNSGLNGIKSLSEPEADKRRKQLKEAFMKAEKVSLYASLASIEWPESELRSIAQLYEKYESGEKEPSPIEEVENALAKDGQNPGTYNKDDFWGKPEIIERERIELYTDKSGNKALRYVGSGKPVDIPGLRGEIKHVVAGRFVVVYNGNQKKIKGCTSKIRVTDRVQEYDLVDLDGQTRIRDITGASHYGEYIKVSIARCVGSGAMSFHDVGDVKRYDLDLNLISSETDMQLNPNWY